MTKGIQANRVTQWFVEHIPGVFPPLSFELIPGGRSNMTFKVTDTKKQAFVLRRPPLGHILESAHDVGREHKIISALGPTDIPVAPALGLCKDKTVNEADFYVMKYVDGRVLSDSVEAEKVPRDERRRIGMDAIAILCRLHAVNPDDVGLGDLGRKEDYVARQIHRWTKQWESSKTEDVPEMEEVGKLLKKNIPRQIGTAIVHGDFRIGNFIVDRGKVVAVLDWELCTLGDPLADMGYLLNWWNTPEEVERGKGDQAPNAAGGFPSREEILAYYQKNTGRDVTQIHYYRALSYWRLAAISQGVYRRYKSDVMGSAPNVELDFLKQRVSRLSRAALELLQS